MFALVLLDLTLREIVSDIPHDLAALVAYTMILLFVGFAVAGSRPRRRSGKEQEPGGA